MKKSEFDSMTNTEKVAYLNKYLGKTNQFKEDNDFSWTYATNHCSFVKEGSVYIAKEEPVQKELEDDEQHLLTVMKYQKVKRISKSFRLPETLLQELSQYAENSLLKETDIVICGIKKFLEEN